MDDGGRKLDEVAKAAGVSPRTVRYYIQRGLLPPPRFRGPDTAYGDEHVVRLRAIRRLQDAFWPLDAIAGLLSSQNTADLDAIADGSRVPAPRGAVLDRAEAAQDRAAPERGAVREELPTEHVRRIELAEGVVLEVRQPLTRETEELVRRLTGVVHPPPPRPRRSR